MIVNRARVKWYRFSYACHRLAWPVRWLTLYFAALAVIEFFELHHAFVRLPGPFSHYLNPVSASAIARLTLEFRLELAWVVIFGFLTLISAWFDIWFRYAAWCFVQYWRIGLVIIIAGALVIGRHSLGASLWTVLKMILAFGVLLKVAAAILIVLLLYGAYRARGQLVILPFANYTGDDTLKCCVEGLAPLLLNELGRIARLYAAMDDATLAEKSGRGLDRGLPATVSVEDVGDVLQSAVSSQSVIKFWGIEIPVGSLLRLFGRLARGPRLSGSLHKEGERLVLIASIDRGAQQGASWRVTPEDLPAAANGSDTDLVGRMMDQLAYRVFADRVPAISQRWQAVRCYTEGLRVLRVTTRTKKDKEANLRQAERYFLQALSEDNKFALNHYNLGLVYNALFEWDAARAAFCQAVKEDPNLTKAYYAIALDAWRREDYPTALGYCHQVIAQQPTFAQAWDLQGLTQRKIQEQQFGPLESGQHPEIWPEILANRAIAAALAWRGLCGARLRRRSLAEARVVAAKCVRGLAVAHAMMGDLRRAASTMEQAIFLAPGDADLHFELGKILTNPEAAARHLTTATRIDPGQGLYWAHLAETLAQSFKRTGRESVRQDARTACERVLEYASATDKEAHKKLWAGLKAIGDDQEIRAEWEHAMDYACNHAIDYSTDDVKDDKGLERLRAALEELRADPEIRTACERATKFASSGDKNALARLLAGLEAMGKSESEIRVEYARAINDPAGIETKALANLRAALEGTGKSESEIVAACQHVLHSPAGRDAEALGKCREVRAVLRENAIRAACERSRDRATGADTKALEKFMAALAVIDRSESEIRTACEHALDNVNGIDKKALDQLRAAHETVGQEETLAVCERARDGASGADKEALGKLRAAFEVIGKSENDIRAACERAVNNAGGMDKKASDQLRAALDAMADTGILAAYDRAIGVSSGVDKEALKKLKAALLAEAPSPILRFLAGFIQTNTDRTGYLGRLTALENWFGVVMLRKYPNGEYGGWDSWAYGQAAGKLAQNLLETDPTRAQVLAERAIRSLSRQYPGVIREQTLYCILAQAYRKQGKLELLPQALLNAQRAVVLNPEGAWERSILADVYGALGEYESAEAEWNACLDLNPDPESWTNIGSVYWNQGVALRDPAERRKAFRRVIEVFARALKILQSINLDQQNLRGQFNRYGYVHYWIGRFHRELLEFDQAVAHLQAAKNMGYKPLESTVYLGWAHMEVKNYDAAETSFREARSRVRTQQKQGRQLSEVDSGLGEEMPLNELLIMTYFLWSFSYSDRGARPKKAEALARRARRLIPQLEASKAQAQEANYFGCLGYAQLRMGHFDEAARTLECSVALGIDAGNYIHLAEAYYEQAVRDKALRDSCVAKALECCVLARDLDLRQQYGLRISDLEDRLGALGTSAR